jgi:small-conductance mechanosensitive channel
MKIVVVILVALVVFLLLKAMSIGLGRLAKYYSRWRIRMNLFTAFEFIIWIAFIFWSLDYLMRSLFVYRYLVIALMLVLTAFVSWYLINDMISGIIFKVKHKLQPGAYIRTGKYAGEIRSLRLTDIHIRTDDGRMIRIPYSQLNQEVILELFHAGSSEEHQIQIRVSNTISKTEAEKQIFETILNSPWSILNEEPTIAFLREDENEYIFEVTFLLLNTKHLNFIETALKRNAAIKVVVPL